MTVTYWDMSQLLPAPKEKLVLIQQFYFIVVPYFIHFTLIQYNHYKSIHVTAMPQRTLREHIVKLKESKVLHCFEYICNDIGFLLEYYYIIIHSFLYPRQGQRQKNILDRALVYGMAVSTFTHICT